MSLNRLVLVLNVSYEAVNVISAKRALTLVMGGKADVEIPSKHFTKTAKLNIQIPSVIKLKKYRRVPRHNRAVSRKSIMLRDRFTCQYCRKSFTTKELTLDHVIPRSRSGSNDWSNLVSCCFPCNNRKGSRTPEEAGMVLARKPAAIGIHGKHRLLMGDASENAEWDQFLFC